MLQLRCAAIWTAILLLLESCAVQAGMAAVLGVDLDQHADVRVVKETPSTPSQQQPYPTADSPNPCATAADASASVAFLSDSPTSNASSTTPLVLGCAVAGTASLAVVGVLILVLRRRQCRARMANAHGIASSATVSTTMAGLTHAPQKRDRGRSRPRLPRMRSLTVLSLIGHPSATRFVASESPTSPAMSCFSAYDDPFSATASMCEPCSANVPGSASKLHFSVDIDTVTPRTPSHLAGNSSESETHLHEEDIVAVSLSRARPSPGYLPPSFNYPSEDFSATDSRSSLSLVCPHTSHKMSESSLRRDPERGL